MIVAALVTFGILLLAWLVAPAGEVPRPRRTGLETEVTLAEAA